jgi:hypothetical protein
MESVSLQSVSRQPDKKKEQVKFGLLLIYYFFNYSVTARKAFTLPLP